ncbi:MAG: hypothetical protein MI784_17520 [Cytophagales bacterium]|nr:hypothetical protein [Cytophagales bacterium]
MASIRDSKKTVNYLVSEVIGESLAQMGAISDLSKEAEFEKIIGEAIVLRSQLFDKIKVAKGEQDKKAAFKAIEKELIEEVDKLFERLFETAKA